MGIDRIIPALRVIIRAAAHRCELAALELAAARDHAVGTLALWLGAAALTLAGGFFVMVLVVALVWGSAHRELILGLTGLGMFLLAAGLVWLSATRLRKWRPLVETRRQLSSDHACLDDLFTRDTAER